MQPDVPVWCLQSHESLAESAAWHNSAAHPAVPTWSSWNLQLPVPSHYVLLVPKRETLQVFNFLGLHVGLSALYHPWCWILLKLLLQLARLISRKHRSWFVMSDLNKKKPKHLNSNLDLFWEKRPRFHAAYAKKCCWRKVTWSKQDSAAHRASHQITNKIGALCLYTSRYTTLRY